MNTTVCINEDKTSKFCFWALWLDPLARKLHVSHQAEGKRTNCGFDEKQQ